MKKVFIPLFAAAMLTAGLSSCGGGSTFDLNTALADNELGYVILVGEDGNPEALDRTKGCVDALNAIAKEGGFTAKELARKTCIDGTQSRNDTVAKETVEGWAQQYKGKLDFIVSNNDGMAIAASGARGLLKGTPIIGFDALGAACDMIKAGTLAGSVSQNGDDQALATLRALEGMLANKTPVINADYGGRAELNLTDLDDHIIQTKFAAVTKENADNLKPGAYVDLTESSTLKGKKILAAVYSNNDNFIKETYRKALDVYAKKLGATIDFVEGDGSADEKLREAISTKISGGTTYDAFAFNIITHANYEQYLDIVGEGKPVVFFNRQPKTADNSGVADLSGRENVYFVGSGSTGQGTAQGQIIKDWWKAQKWEKPAA